MKRIILWAATHSIQGVQLEELGKNGDTVMLLNLHDINLDLSVKIKRIEPGSNYLELSRDLYKSLDKLQEEYPEHKIQLIQPAGNPNFHFNLGMVTVERAAAGIPTFDVLFSYSKRVSEDKKMLNGEIKTISTFKHIMFE